MPGEDTSRLYSPSIGSSTSRMAETAREIFRGFSGGALTVVGYAGCDTLADARRTHIARTISCCWTHWRRRFVGFGRTKGSPLCEERIARIAQLYRIEAEIRGRDAETRAAVRQTLSKPIANALRN